ncbi:MAG: DUF92 domain-containing protein [Thaumarchaeota archaeon]|nr:DUF92 domain-containing protein [Nitrososphaerota archaeon]MBI3023191.1 DUF92 domain-containing protein [Nitrososphaerota archaeon]
MTSIGPIDALIQLAVVLIFALIAIASKSIDKGGFLASVFVGYSILIGGGWEWFAVVATFFTLGVGFTYYKYEYKESLGSAQEKGGARNWPNIIANGGVAAVLGLCELIFGGSIFAIMYLGAMAAAAADTVATEVGLLSHSSPRLITHLRTRVSPGTSGGVTALGFIGSLLASLIIGILALVVGIVDGGVKLIIVALFGGVVGSLGDSLLGADVQRKGYCTVCGKPSEGTIHCGEKVSASSGSRFIDNNIVNLIATAIGAVAGLLIALVLP